MRWVVQKKGQALNYLLRLSQRTSELFGQLISVQKGQAYLPRGREMERSNYGALAMQLMAR